MAGVDVFMDSSGFFALWDVGDQHHSEAVRLQENLNGKRRRFLTTEYVVDETGQYSPETGRTSSVLRATKLSNDLRSRIQSVQSV